MLKLLQLFIQYAKSVYCYLNNLSWVLLVWLVKTLQNNSQSCRATNKIDETAFSRKALFTKMTTYETFFDKNVVENIFSPPFFNKLDLPHSQISSLSYTKDGKAFYLSIFYNKWNSNQDGWRSLLDDYSLQTHNSYYLLIIYSIFFQIHIFYS